MSATHEAIAATALASASLDLIATIKKQIIQGNQAEALANLAALENAMKTLGGGL